MSEIKALESLRGYADVNWDPWPEARSHLRALIDATEAEVAERFMELPVDAGGKPIRIGDYLQVGNTSGEVVALTYCPSNGKLPWEWQCDTGDWYNTAFARHAKPRTVEDVLKELEGMRGNGATYEDVVARCSELAAELRELIGGAE